MLISKSFLHLYMKQEAVQLFTKQNPKFYHYEKEKIYSDYVGSAFHSAPAIVGTGEKEDDT